MQFQGPNNERIKIYFDLYTLACNTFLNEVAAFRNAVWGSADKYATLEDCYAYIDNSLFATYESTPSDLPQAAGWLADELRAKTGPLGSYIPKLASCIDSLAGQIVINAPAWSCSANIVRWHEIGRELSLEYFDSRNSQYQRFDRKAKTIKVEYSSSSRSTFSHQEYLLESEGNPTVSDTIFIHFSIEDGVKDYLTYPFFFMHEYVSHMFSEKTDSELFYDGWLFWAAYEFLIHNSTYAKSLGLESEQINAFDEGTIKASRAKTGYDQARRVCNWDKNEKLGCFHNLMHQLASIGRTESQSKYKFSHSEFLHAVARCYEEDAGLLKQLLGEFRGNVFSTWTKLKRHFDIR